MADVEARGIANLGIVGGDCAALAASAKRPFGVGDFHRRLMLTRSHCSETEDWRSSHISSAVAACTIFGQLFVGVRKPSAYGVRLPRAMACCSSTSSIVAIRAAFR